MPHVAPDGHITHGRGGTGAFVDNVAIDTGGDATWLEPGVVVYQHGGPARGKQWSRKSQPKDAGWYLATYDLATGTTMRAITDAADPYYDRGANTLAAGGGIWAAWEATHGVFSSTRFEVPAGSLLDVGPDGAIAYKPSYQAEGGARVRELDGTDWWLTDEGVMELQLLGAQRAIWRSVGALVRVQNLPVPVTVPGAVFTPRAVLVDKPTPSNTNNFGEWWICYYADGIKQLVLHPFGSTVGYAITSGDAWPDVALIGGTTLRVVWSVTLGEAAGDVLVRDIDVALETRVELNVPIDPPDPPDPPAVDPPTIVTMAYDASGVAPMECYATLTLDGGPADAISWLLDDAIDGTTAATRLDHTYQLDVPGTYALGAKVSGPGGSDQTSTSRVVTVTAPDTPEPEPGPEPEPPASSGGRFMFKLALSEPAIVCWRWGGGQSLEPPTNADDPNRAAFEYGRTTVGPDEECNGYEFADGTWGIRSPNGRSWLSIQGDGSKQERAASDDAEPGPWERFTKNGNVFTELEKSGVTRPPVTFVTP